MRSVVSFLARPRVARRVVLGFATAFFAVAVLVACDSDLTFNPDNSINIMLLSPEWPKKKKKLTEPQKEILAKYGRPEVMRLLWNPEGRVTTKDQLQTTMKDTSPKNLPPMAWVYPERNMEYWFGRDGKPTEHPIGDDIKLIIRYGDPEQVHDLPGGVTRWTFYSAGKSFDLVNGKQVSSKDFPAMGHFGSK